MLIAITSCGENLDSQLDPRFGRAQKFIIYDLQQEAFHAVDNSINLNLAQGAGIQAAKTVIDNGAQVLISGHCGPKAFKVLNDSKIKVLHSEEIAVKDVISAYKSGKLQLMQE